MPKQGFGWNRGPCVGHSGFPGGKLPPTINRLSFFLSLLAAGRCGVLHRKTFIKYQQYSSCRNHPIKPEVKMDKVDQGQVN